MRPIKCAEIQSSIIDCIEKELPTDDVLAHLEFCEGCQEEFRDYHFILKKLRNFEFKEPADAFWKIFPEKVLAQVNDVKNALASDCDHPIHVESSGTEKHDNGDSDALSREDTGNVVPLLQADSLSHHQGGSKRSIETGHSLFFNSSLTKILFPIAATILVAVGIVGYVENEAVLPAGYYSHDTLAFQAKINTITPVAMLARQLPTDELETNAAGNNWYAFSSQPIKANPFYVGTHYAEILALLGDGDIQASSNHMTQLRHELLKNQLSDDLVNSVEQTENTLASKDASQNDRSQALLDFGSKYRKYMVDVGGDALVFFQLGEWAVNMSLAALAESPIVKLEQSNAKYFTVALQRLSVPVGIVKVLEDMDKLFKKSELTNKQYNDVYRLSLMLRTQLS